MGAGTSHMDLPKRATLIMLANGLGGEGGKEGKREAVMEREKDRSGEKMGLQPWWPSSHPFNQTGRGDRRTLVPGARVLYTIGSGVLRGAVCVRRAARPNCHTLALSL